MKTLHIGQYEDLSDEYYDAHRHPTCANFREASAQLLSRWLPQLLNASELVCEIGAGKSLVAELLAEAGRSCKNLVLIDSSLSMLSYSMHRKLQSASLIQGNAYSLPLKSNSLTGIVSSLGDPYNRSEFWRETSRVLKPGGTVLFTTPSYEWASGFRRGTQEAKDFAEFTLVNGEIIYVPSFIFDMEEQMRLMRQFGFKMLENENVRVSSLKMGPLSSKLVLKSGEDENIVTGFLAKKI